MRVIITFAALLMVASCSLPRVKAGDFRLDSAKKQCMELAEVMCGKVESCVEDTDWNDCMMTAFNDICFRIDAVGPGYRDCYKNIKSMQCTDKYDESCTRAFIKRTTVGG